MKPNIGSSYAACNLTATMHDDRILFARQYASKGCSTKSIPVQAQARKKPGLIDTIK
jgi:hypothetical protein